MHPWKRPSRQGAFHLAIRPFHLSWSLWNGIPGTVSTCVYNVSNLCIGVFQAEWLLMDFHGLCCKATIQQHPATFKPCLIKRKQKTNEFPYEHLDINTTWHPQSFFTSRCACRCSNRRLIIKRCFLDSLRRIDATVLAGLRHRLSDYQQNMFV